MKEQILFLVPQHCTYCISHIAYHLSPMILPSPPPRMQYLYTLSLFYFILYFYFILSSFVLFGTLASYDAVTAHVLGSGTVLGSGFSDRWYRYRIDGIGTVSPSICMGQVGNRDLGDQHCATWAPRKHGRRDGASTTVPLQASDSRFRVRSRFFQGPF